MPRVTRARKSAPAAVVVAPAAAAAAAAVDASPVFYHVDGFILEAYRSADDLPPPSCAKGGKGRPSHAEGGEGRPSRSDGGGGVMAARVSKASKPRGEGVAAVAVKVEAAVMPKASARKDAAAECHPAASRAAACRTCMTDVMPEQMRQCARCAVLLHGFCLNPPEILRGDRGGGGGGGGRGRGGERCYDDSEDCESGSESGDASDIGDSVDGRSSDSAKGDHRASVPSLLAASDSAAAQSPGPQPAADAAAAEKKPATLPARKSARASVRAAAAAARAAALAKAGARDRRRVGAAGGGGGSGGGGGGAKATRGGRRRGQSGGAGGGDVGRKRRREEGGGKGAQRRREAPDEPCEWLCPGCRVQDGRELYKVRMRRVFQAAIADLPHAGGDDYLRAVVRTTEILDPGDEPVDALYEWRRSCAGEEEYDGGAGCLDAQEVLPPAKRARAKEVLDVEWESSDVPVVLVGNGCLLRKRPRPIVMGLGENDGGVPMGVNSNEVEMKEAKAEEAELPAVAAASRPAKLPPAVATPLMAYVQEDPRASLLTNESPSPANTAVSKVETPVTALELAATSPLAATGQMSLPLPPLMPQQQPPLQDQPVEAPLLEEPRQMRTSPVLPSVQSITRGMPSTSQHPPTAFAPPSGLEEQPRHALYASCVSVSGSGRPDLPPVYAAPSVENGGYPAEPYGGRQYSQMHAVAPPVQNQVPYTPHPYQHPPPAQFLYGPYAASQTANGAFPPARIATSAPGPAHASLLPQVSAPPQHRGEVSLQIGSTYRGTAVAPGRISDAGRYGGAGQQQQKPQTQQPQHSSSPIPVSQISAGSAPVGYQPPTCPVQAPAYDASLAASYSAGQPHTLADSPDVLRFGQMTCNRGLLQHPGRLPLSQPSQPSYVPVCSGLGFGGQAYPRLDSDPSRPEVVATGYGNGKYAAGGGPGISSGGGLSSTTRRVSHPPTTASAGQTDPEWQRNHVVQAQAQASRGYQPQDVAPSPQRAGEPPSSAPGTSATHFAECSASYGSQRDPGPTRDVTSLPSTAYVNQHSIQRLPSNVVAPVVSTVTNGYYAANQYDPQKMDGAVDQQAQPQQAAGYQLTQAGVYESMSTTSGSRANPILAPSAQGQASMFVQNIPRQQSLEVDPRGQNASTAGGASRSAVVNTGHSWPPLKPQRPSERGLGRNSMNVQGKPLAENAGAQGNEQDRYRQSSRAILSAENGFVPYTPCPTSPFYRLNCNSVPVSQATFPASSASAARQTFASAPPPAGFDTEARTPSYGVPPPQYTNHPAFGDTRNQGSWQRRGDAGLPSVASLLGGNSRSDPSARFPK